jgi:hypothetical protein
MYLSHVTLYVERWRVLLQVRIDNTGGGRPSYYSGSTPQLRWPDGRTQGESLDLMRALEKAYPDSTPLWPPDGVDASDVDEMVRKWKMTFPRSARPSSRAAFLFDCASPRCRGMDQPPLPPRRNAPPTPNAQTPAPPARHGRRLVCAGMDRGRRRAATLHVRSDAQSDRAAARSARRRAVLLRRLRLCGRRRVGALP